MDTLIHVIQEYCRAENVNSENKLAEDLHLCSFDVAMIISDMEDHGWEFTYEKKIKTVQELFSCFIRRE